MCEQVILSEEIENEKAIKHRKKLKIGRYAIDRYADGIMSETQKGLKRVTYPHRICNKLTNIQFLKYHILKFSGSQAEKGFDKFLMLITLHFSRHEK